MKIEMILTYRAPDGSHKMMKRPTEVQGSVRDSEGFTWILTHLPAGSVMISIKFAAIPLELQDVVLLRAKARAQTSRSLV